MALGKVFRLRVRRERETIRGKIAFQHLENNAEPT